MRPFDYELTMLILNMESSQIFDCHHEHDGDEHDGDERDGDDGYDDDEGV